MSEVKKVTVFAYLEDGGEPEVDYHDDPDGKYVLASDYDALVEECERLRGEVRDLHTTMMAAAVEIQGHWAAHCDEEGYGPANLMHRLEHGIASQYGYNAETVVRMEAQRDAAMAELAALKGGQEAVATVTISHFRQDPTMENVDFQLDAKLPCGTHKLYLAPPAQASAWVPVSERLPAETYAYGCHTDDVLCRTRSGKLIIAMLARTTTGPVWYDQQSQERDVTHWQPLPAAPTPGASDGKGGAHDD